MNYVTFVRGFLEANRRENCVYSDVVGKRKVCVENEM